MRHCRSVMAELHRDKDPREILQLMRAAGLFSPRTCDYDALRSVAWHLKKIQHELQRK
jgi:hypothetical protein